MNATMAATAVARIDGVVSASAWTKIEGRERIYVKLTRMHKGRARDGFGYEGYVDATGRFTAQGAYSNSETEAWHTEHNTINVVCAAVQAIPAPATPILTPEEEAEKEDHIR